MRIAKLTVLLFLEFPSGCNSYNSQLIWPKFRIQCHIRQLYNALYFGSNPRWSVFNFLSTYVVKLFFNFFETSVCDYLLKKATFVFFKVSKIFKISKKIVKISEFCQSRGEQIVVGNHLGYGERKNTLLVLGQFC